MKYISNSQFAFSNRRLLISLFFALVSVSLALVGLGAISKGNSDTKQSMSSPQAAAASANAKLNSKNATLGDNPYRYLDEKGNRANGIKPGIMIQQEGVNAGGRHEPTSPNIGRAASSGGWSSEPVDIWHDRAVFHFLTDPTARSRYVDAVRKSLSPGGHIVVATFGPHGPETCSGLEVLRFTAEALHAEFGDDFAKLSESHEIHNTPWGSDQEFVYCYCRMLG
jgi:hypothetical protein